MADLKRRIAQSALNARAEGTTALPKLSAAELEAVAAGRASPVIMSRFENAWQAAKRAAWLGGADWAMHENLNDAQLQELFERAEQRSSGR